MDVRIELHRLIDALDDDADRALMHAAVDKLDDETAAQALTYMRAIHGLLPE